MLLAASPKSTLNTGKYCLAFTSVHPFIFFYKDGICKVSKDGPMNIAAIFLSRQLSSQNTAELFTRSAAGESAGVHGESWHCSIVFSRTKMTKMTTQPLSVPCRCRRRQADDWPKFSGTKNGSENR